MGLLPYTARVAPAQPSYQYSLVRNCLVDKYDYEILRDLIGDRVAPHQTTPLHSLGWSYADFTWHKTHFGMTLLILVYLLE
ncbi:hypothetical protein DPMN_108614 [Dreissena polymorpha]|uniref:Uncharacterized protein n=1 Tax=Dreissena polymorpha TaxID=45954 RepID=A0A9D4QLC0_DREPO|nr:hypothetical protein DPMN_108562 [Dreissena polymorpha]KAH3835266.1 hypothetical protein DPMN_108614 [Dreissena polymorpha]